jgi:hypothetical protein
LSTGQNLPSGHGVPSGQSVPMRHSLPSLQSGSAGQGFPSGQGVPSGHSGTSGQSFPTGGVSTVQSVPSSHIIPSGQSITGTSGQSVPSGSSIPSGHTVPSGQSFPTGGVSTGQSVPSGHSVPTAQSFSPSQSIPSGHTTPSTSGQTSFTGQSVPSVPSSSAPAPSGHMVMMDKDTLQQAAQEIHNIEQMIMGKMMVGGGIGQPLESSKSLESLPEVHEVSGKSVTSPESSRSGFLMPQVGEGQQQQQQFGGFQPGYGIPGYFVPARGSGGAVPFGSVNCDRSGRAVEKRNADPRADPCFWWGGGFGWGGYPYGLGYGGYGYWG